MIGIYKITSPSKKVYIGQSINILKRWKFYNQLNCKSQVKLYNSFLKYGIKKHKFEVLQICDIEKLNELEKYYVDLFQTFNSKHGLNLRDGGGNKASPSIETKKKMSDASIGKKMSEEAKRKMSISMKGRILSIETIKKITEKTIGQKRNENTLKKMSKWVRTDEMKKKMSEASLGKKKSKASCDKMSESQKKIILNMQTGIFYFGVSDAHSSEKRLSKGMLYHKLNGRKFNNTNFLYV